MIRAAALVLSVALVVSRAAADVKDCGGPSPKCTISNLSMDPPNPGRGDTFKYEATFSCTEDVNGGTGAQTRGVLGWRW